MSLGALTNIESLWPGRSRPQWIVRVPPAAVPHTALLHDSLSTLDYFL